MRTIPDILSLEKYEVREPIEYKIGQKARSKTDHIPVWYELDGKKLSSSFQRDTLIGFGLLKR